jgi:enoyl-CoA hydratase
VHAVHPLDGLAAAAQELAETLAGKSRIAVARALEATIAGGDLALEPALCLEASLFGLCFATEDMREGTRAFLDKRKPRFTGR